MEEKTGRTGKIKATAPDQAQREGDLDPTGITQVALTVDQQAEAKVEEGNRKEMEAVNQDPTPEEGHGKAKVEAKLVLDRAPADHPTVLKDPQLAPEDKATGPTHDKIPGIIAVGEDMAATTSIRTLPILPEIPRRT